MSTPSSHSSNPYFKSRTTSICTHPKRQSHPKLTDTCECAACRSAATLRSHQIEAEIAEEAEKKQAENFVMLLGHREATDDVAKVLLRVSEDYEGGDLGIDRDVVVGHALRLVDSAVVTLLERDRTTFHDVDQVFLQRLKSNLQSGPHITTWDAEELVRLWQELSDTQKDCTWTTSVLHFLSRLPIVTSKEYCVSEEDVFHLPLRYQIQTSSIFHTRHTASSRAGDIADAFTLNIISTINSNSHSRKFTSCFHIANSFIYVIDLRTYSQCMMPGVPDTNVLSDSLHSLKHYQRSRRFDNGSAFLWLTHVKEFRDLVASGRTSDHHKPVVSEDTVMDCAFDDFLIRKCTNAVQGRDNHVILLDVLDERGVRYAVSEMVRFLNTIAQSFPVSSGS